MSDITVFFSADLGWLDEGGALLDAAALPAAPAVLVISPAEWREIAGRLGPDHLPIVIGAARDGPDPFLALPSRAPRSVVRRSIEAARRVLELRQEIADQQATLDGHITLQRELLEIGDALATERDLQALLERILTSARLLVSADAGSLYLVERTPGGEASLRFALAQNDSCAMPWRESVLPLDRTSIAGMVAATGVPLRIDDAYDLPTRLPFQLNRAFDEASGYLTRSLLAVPMKTRAEERVGVLQLINRKRDAAAVLTSAREVDREVVPFTPRDQGLVQALASQAAVVIESSRLVDEIHHLFESFVRASVTAIEQRDPPTSGHSFRVASYTVALATATERNPPPSVSGLRFTADDLQQLRYAALLHDVGKLGVRESVLTKAQKLYPYQGMLVRERFEHARRALQLERVRRLLAELIRRSRAPAAADLERLGAELEEIDADLDRALLAIQRANNPTIRDAAVGGVVEQIARRVFPGRHGDPRPLLEPHELHLLHVPRGNLDEEERQEIESHVVHSFRFLNTLPWPRHLTSVPEIAARHHEKLDGSGYPNRLTAPEIPVEVRMLTISDIYDALTAGDRPYKHSLDPPRALEILEDEVRDGALDPDLVRIFIGAKVYRTAPPQPGEI